MKTSIGNLHKKLAEILRALDRGERIVILYRRRPKAIMQPIAGKRSTAAIRAKDHPAFGLWADRDDLRNVRAPVR